MKVLVIGQGGREHALLWKIKQAKKVKSLYSAPGNGGTAGIATNVPISPDDIAGLSKFCESEKIDLSIVGPEIPLSLGIVDIFKEKGLRVFGPTRAAAQLESSKIFTKEIARKENIPTADCEIFDNAEKAKDFIESKKAPLVVKADGLAQGKGVIVAKDKSEALRAVERIMVEKTFGHSGERVIVEECLEGEEASIIVISDGENIVPLASSQDHKRAFDGDKGPNTGGMGAYSPTPLVTDKIFEETVVKIIKPAILGMKERGTPCCGVLYAGIMITQDGPKLLEFNVRFGDPETQAILPRLNSDLLELIEACEVGALKNYSLKWDKRTAVCAVMASGGYPGKYEKGKEISGIEKAALPEDVLVFHAGTKAAGKKILTSGGRVLNVVALGDGIRETADKVYRACKTIKFDGAHYRKDIGRRALNLEVLQ
ncbi:MAG: phosphoribosylamine--glycine ligase [Omnitrophica bacterium]|nr:phosphoribosylamine--glycine ligase [Candidatus Omnitrophota bacterium]